MDDPLRQLYESRDYPAMSHPSSDPAVTAVAARLAGLGVRPPSGARILELGCGSGHNLIPLAQRWPRSRFLGVDFSGRAVSLARDLAGAAGLGNCEFREADIREFDAGNEQFDYIIAHGLFSWVADDVKAAIFAICAHSLAEDGLVTVSFNSWAGWEKRMPVIEKVRAIMEAGAENEVRALEILKTVVEAGSEEELIANDMLAKGREILPFDDFAPINEPWTLENFVKAADGTGFRWLGDSEPGGNLPQGLPETTVEQLAPLANNPLALQTAADRELAREFRSVILCRKERPVNSQVNLKELMDMSVGFRFPTDSPPGLGDHILTILKNNRGCIPVWELVADLSFRDQREALRQVVIAIQDGTLKARIEPLRIAEDVPERPKLDEFRMECAKWRLPLVDAWHVACRFPARHHGVLERMDGSMTIGELEEFAGKRCPNLDVRPWLAHLAERGMFV
ncbi:MAG: methyltransferase domain-containing protein [Verrucomicrobiales bacterium]|nr:class I SAM-dependent methyltransferase [Verrucomicrobiota bacterium JB025]